MLERSPQDATARDCAPNQADSAAAASLSNVASMFFLLCEALSATPLTHLPRVTVAADRWSTQLCVTRQPDAVGSTSYTQSHQFFPNTIRPKEKRLGASKAFTFTDVDHDLLPFWLRPLNTAPTAGPFAPLVHVPPWFSGDHSPIRGRSVTISNTLSGGAAMSRVTETGVFEVIQTL